MCVPYAGLWSVKCGVLMPTYMKSNIFSPGQFDIKGQNYPYSKNTRPLLGQLLEQLYSGLCLTSYLRTKQKTNSGFQTPCVLLVSQNEKKGKKCP